VVPATDEGLIRTAREARLIPGEGGLDLVGIFAQLPWDLPVSVEIPNRECMAELGLREWARRALAASRTVLGRRDEAVERGESLRRNVQSA
jgi:hypothetical protein